MSLLIYQGFEVYAYLRGLYFFA